LPPDFLSRLARVVGDEGLRTDEEALDAASSDETSGLEPSRPDAVARPKDTAQVAEVLRLCSDAGVFVTPRGAGSGKAGGCVPVFGGVVLALDRLAAIEEIHEEDGVARVQPGVILGDLQRAVEERGLFYPPDPASLESCTLGGNVATNAGGPRALKYGVTGDYLLGAEVALPTGEVMRTGRRTLKGVAGYDMTSLLCGSEGTLGVITGITLRLVTRPAAVHTALVTFPSSERAAEGVRRVLSGGVVPRTLEYLDGHAIAALRAHGGSPYRFADDAGAALLLETDGALEDVAFDELRRAVDAASAAGATDARIAGDARQRRELWQSRRLLSEATRRLRGKKVSEDLVVPRSRIPEMVARIAALGDEHGLLTCSYGHAGDGNLHAQVLYSDDEERERVELVISRMLDEAIALGGTISGEHGIGVAKKRFLPREQGQTALAVQQRIKDAFDPAGVLNPGKLLPEKVALRAAAAAT
jgi:glycolate oxidase